MRPCARVGCPSLVRKGYCETCAARPKVKTPAEQNRPSAHARGYTRQWSEASRGFLARNPMCEGLRAEINGEVTINTHPGRFVLATMTDHIVPQKGDHKRFWDQRNWQPACAACHGVKSGNERGAFEKRTGWRGLG